MYFTKLTCTTALLLVTIVGTCCLGDGLTIRYARLLKHDRELIVVLHTPLESAQMELALT